MALLLRVAAGVTPSCLASQPIRFVSRRAGVMAPGTGRRGRSIMSRYFDGPLKLLNRKPKPFAEPVAVEELAPAQGQEASADAGAVTVAKQGADALAGLKYGETPLQKLHTTETLASVLGDLEHGREVRDEVLKLVENSTEYANYEKDIHFEMSLVRRRYLAGGEMTPERRSQLQAHLGQIQDAIMREHAEKAADVFTESLSKDERELLARQFGRLEDSRVPIEAVAARTPNVAGVMSRLQAMCDTLLAAKAKSGSSAEEAPTKSTKAADVPTIPESK